MRAWWRAAVATAAVAIVLTVVGCFSDLDALVPYPCANDSSCPDGYACVDGYGCVSAGVCDVQKQDCADSTHTKCTIVRDHTNANQTTCLQPTGTHALGESCTRSTLGVDDCTPGLFCNGGLSPDAQPVCRKFCKAPADCPSGFSCIGVFTITDEGICAPSCNLGDTTCNAQNSCRALRTPTATASFACTADGNVGEWQACDANRPCGHDLACSADTNGYCFAFCGASKACSGGQTCVAASGYGACECDLFAGCSTGMSCRPEGNEKQGAFGQCEINGPGTLGQTCSTTTDCAANLVCWGTQQGGFRCTAVCDAAHTCSAGSCHALSGIPNAGGVCE